MKKISLLLLCILFSYHYCTAQHLEDEKKFLLVVDFQADFENDNATFYIEDCLIFENVILVSNEIIGTTGERVRIFENKEKQIIVEYKDKNTECNISKDKVQMKIILNGKRQDIVIDISKGIYIGLIKADDGKVYPFQSEFPFRYS